ncbi:MAG: hypothetical protein M3360_08490 [Actinomycetota bacterium]|nr:hypothetical protein [Actinomycetota bacterium]
MGRFQSGSSRQSLDRIGARALGRLTLREWFSQTARTMLLLGLTFAALLSTTLLAREYQIFLLKSFLVVFLSLLPGWLYLNFIKTKGTGLYDEYVLNLYRLRIDSVANLPKPPPHSSYWSEWESAMRSAGQDQVSRNIYLKKFESVYGRSAIPESRRSARVEEDASAITNVAEEVKDAFLPVMWATVLLAVGWIVVVQPELFKAFEPLGAIDITGLPPVDAESLRLGFIGSYVFILESLVRRYLQSDLKTAAYVSAMTRVIVVTALLAALGPLMDSWNEAVVASSSFLVGIFPELGLRLLKQGAATVGHWITRLPGDERFPITDLDGINLWSRARLFEEGIEDMQNLTTANIVDLMLNTRMPINRLVDWVDQAFLYIRVSGPDRGLLRRMGVRTATDLLNVFDTDSVRDPEFHGRLLRALNKVNGKDDTGPSATEGIRRSLLSEVNLWHVQEWKRHEWLKAPQPL